MNELLSYKGIILMSIGAALIANVKSIFGWLWKVFQNRLFSTIDIPSTSRSYDTVLRYLSDTYGHRSSNFTVESRGGGGGGILPPGETKAKIYLGFGEFIVWINSYPVWVTHERKELSIGSNGYIFQILKMRSFKRTRSSLLSIIAVAERKYQEDGIRFYTNHYSNWNHAGTRQSRNFSNVILPVETERKIKALLDRFVTSRSKCLDLGIPHRASIFLHGIPGTGKTSTAIAIADYLKFPIYYLSFASLNDSVFTELVSQIPKNSVLLIEDIDSQLAHIGKASSEINLATVLNVLDGLLSPEGIVTVITGNKKGALDERLFRAGRITLECEFGRTTEDQRGRFARTSGVSSLPEESLPCEIYEQVVDAMLK